MLLGLGLNIYYQLADLNKISSQTALLPYLQIVDLFSVFSDFSDKFLTEHLFFVEYLEGKDNGLDQLDVEEVGIDHLWEVLPDLLETVLVYVLFYCFVGKKYGFLDLLRVVLMFEEQLDG